ncbi:unnamed protein product [Parnassius apollo]|uniref:(apollo) hypothetical protein n=1 Tax=Parnassius apollo TaxID=110799 RepID=A0A8S3XS86_PARAO|nr:unnamed protein product [Parnassius apollo]
MRKTVGRGALSARMIPELSPSIFKEELLPKPSKMTAQEFHKILTNILHNNGQQFSEKWTNEQINKMLLEYAYRGSNITYSSNPSE